MKTVSVNVSKRPENTWYKMSLKQSTLTVLVHHHDMIAFVNFVTFCGILPGTVVPIKYSSVCLISEWPLYRHHLQELVVLLGKRDFSKKLLLKNMNFKTNKVVISVFDVFVLNSSYQSGLNGPNSLDSCIVSCRVQT